MSDALITLHFFAEDYLGDLSWKLADWCHSQGADEWTVTRIEVDGLEAPLHDHFDRTMQSYHLPQALRRHLTASRHLAHVRPLPLWKLNHRSFLALRDFFPESLFHYEPTSEGWLEDPLFYRTGELMLGIVSHESEGLLRVTDRERTALVEAGFPVHRHGRYVGL